MPANYTAGMSKQLTSSGIVTTAGKAGLLLGYALQVGTASQGSVTFRDGGVSGTIRWVDSNVAVTAAGDTTKLHDFTKPIVFSTDIYAVLTGTNTKVCVEYVETGV